MSVNDSSFDCVVLLFPALSLPERELFKVALARGMPNLLKDSCKNDCAAGNPGFSLSLT